MKNFFYNVLILSTTLLLTVLLKPTLVSAVSVSISYERSTSQINETITGTVLLNAKNKSINTLGGRLIINGKAATLSDVSIDNSVTDLWIDTPEIAGNTILFSAAFPGGFSGLRNTAASSNQAAELFSFTLKTAAGGTSTAHVSSLEAFSGRGKIVSATTVPTQLFVRSVRSVATSTLHPSVLVAQDTSPPADFTPVLIHPDPSCDSPLFAVFETTDNETGIDHYKLGYIDGGVSEKLRQIEYQQVTSPHKLNTVRAGSEIAFKAVDKAGNEQLAITEVTEADIQRNCQLAAARSIPILFYLLATLPLALIIAGIWIYQRS